MLCLTRRGFCLGLTSTFAIPSIASVVPVRNYSMYTWAEYESDLVSLGVKKTWKNIRGYLATHGEARCGILRVANFPLMYELAVTKQNGGVKKHCAYTNELCSMLASQFRAIRGTCSCFVNTGVGGLALQCFDRCVDGNMPCSVVVDDDNVAAHICCDVIRMSGMARCAISDSCELSSDVKVLSVLHDCPTNVYSTINQLLRANCGSVILCSASAVDSFRSALSKRNGRVMTFAPRGAYLQPNVEDENLATIVVERRS